METSLTFALTGAGTAPSNAHYQFASEKALVKDFVLRYPAVKPSYRINVVMPRSSSAEYRFMDFMSRSAPNVFMLNSAPSSLPTGEVELVKATARLYETNGFLTPADCGVKFSHDPAYEVDVARDLGISEEDLSSLVEASDSWGFNVHDFSSNELLAITFMIFKQHTSAAGLQRLGLVSDKHLLWFLCIVRTLYRTYAPYHSFWHCVDVAQFAHMLVTHPNPWQLQEENKFALVLAALGHDVLHPGMAYPVLKSISPEFGSRYSSLEEYHSSVFGALVDELLPEIASTTSTVRQAIAATDLKLHCKLTTCRSPTFVHVLKMSDFACTVRPGYGPHYATSVAIFLEFRNQCDICRYLNIHEHHKPFFNPHIPEVEALIDVQVNFLTNMIVPYFKWLSEFYPPFVQHLTSAEQKLNRFENMKRTKSLGFCENYPFVGMVSYTSKPGPEEGARAAP